MRRRRRCGRPKGINEVTNESKKGEDLWMEKGNEAEACFVVFPFSTFSFFFGFCKGGILENVWHVCKKCFAYTIVFRVGYVRGTHTEGEMEDWQERKGGRDHAG